MRTQIFKVIVLLFIAPILSPAFAFDTSTEEKTCSEIGFKPRTEKFENCVSEPYSHKNNSTAAFPIQSKNFSRSGNGS